VAERNLLELKKTSQFRKDLRRMVKRGVDIDLLENIIQTLRQQKQLATKYHDHELTGEFAGFRECHIQPDWLLIYLIDGENLILTAARTGSHSDLF